MVSGFKNKRNKTEKSDFVIVGCELIIALTPYGSEFKRSQTKILLPLAKFVKHSDKDI